MTSPIVENLKQLKSRIQEKGVIRCHYIEQSIGGGNNEPVCNFCAIGHILDMKGFQYFEVVREETDINSEMINRILKTDTDDEVIIGFQNALFDFGLTPNEYDKLQYLNDDSKSEGGMERLYEFIDAMIEMYGEGENA